MALHIKVKVLVTQLCPTLCNLMNCSPPGSSVYGILQARILEWVVIFFSRGLLDPGVEAESPVSQRVCDKGNSGNLCVCVCVCVCTYTHTYGFPGWHGGKESACQRRRHRFDHLVGKILWRRKWQPAPVVLPGKFHEQRSLADYTPWGHRIRRN